MRAAAIGTAALLMGLLVATDLHAQAAGDDRITAGIISRESRNLGYSPNVDADDSGDPRVNVQVDGHSWQIYFYDCDKSGPLTERFCQSFQFFADNDMPHPVPMQTIIRWNKNTTFAKAYLQQGNEAGCDVDRSCAARIEVDVVTAGTGADPGRAFRAYFAIFKQRAIEFRGAIGAN
jgi:hypothetical protein